MNNEPFIIKILSGPYQDNFLELELNKKLTLGGNLDADIIITPDENTPIFAEMIITEENVTFNYFSQAARNHAGELLIPQVNYQLPFIFTLKNIQLALGKPQNIDFMLSKFNQPESTLDDPLLNGETKDNQHPNSTPHITLAHELQDKINQLLPTKKHKIASITVGILILSLIIILLGLAINSHSNEVSYQTTMQDQQNIKKLFFALPSAYSGLSIDTNPSGKIEIYGIVTNQTQILYIKTYFVNYKNLITFELITEQQAIQKIQQIIAQAGQNQLMVGFDPNSMQITLSGIISGTDKLNDLEITISNQIPEIGNVNTDNVFTNDQFSTDLAKITDAFPARLTITHTNNTLDISGYLTDNEKLLFGSLLTPFNKKYSSILNIATQIKNLFDILPFKIFTIYTGSNPYIVTNSGQKVFVGGSIDGFTLSSITNNQIILKGNFTIILNVMQIMENSTLPLTKNATSMPTNNVPLPIIESNPNSTNTVDSITGSPHQQIIGEEIAKQKQSIATEQQQIVKFNKLLGVVKDSGLKITINQEISNLKQDIEVKQRELDNYYKSINQ